MDNGDDTDWKGQVGKAVDASIKEAGKDAANVCTVANTVNNVEVPIAARFGASVHKDKFNGTTRNTVETASIVDEGWGGGVAGALGGAAVGTLIFPIIGTIVGSIIGGILGGSSGGTAAAKPIGDAVAYDVEEWICVECGEKFKVFKYKGEKSHICPECFKPSGR